VGPQQEHTETVWTIHCDGAWCHTGASAAMIITSPVGVKYRYAACLSFALESDRCTNNIADQIEKEYLAKELVLMQYLTAVRSLEKQFKGFTLQHVERNKNEEDDTLAKAAA
jgi:hypothetical protein